MDTRVHDDQLAETLERAIAALISLQRADGHWCGELQGDSILESEYILMKFILGQEREPLADGRDGWETLQKIANYMRVLQREDGSWGQYPGAAADLSATVKAYFALRLLGDDPQSDSMRKAREVVIAHGGAERCNSFSNFYLACLGQISWNAVPAIPPEIVYLPRWFYFHLTKVSAWTRTMILPLSIVATLRPTRPVKLEHGIDELFVDRKARHRLKLVNQAPHGWARFFLTIDKAIKFFGQIVGIRARGKALRDAMDWILHRAGQDGPACTDGLGAIFPPMVYIQVALQAMGYPRNHPIVQRAERELDAFFIESAEAPFDPSEPRVATARLLPSAASSLPFIRIQPCFSPVWDTGIALYALADCGMTIRDEPARRAAEWLLAKECRHVGDWARNLGDARLGESGNREPPGGDMAGAGWYFEYNNAWYPDCDDTAMVAMALRRVGGADNLDAAQRGVDWLLAMQNDDGGWAAFDKTRHRQILEYVPFADHNAMQDPSCPDITGRVLECLSWHGLIIEHPSVRSAIEYIKSHQEPEGCFFGRWGVNYIYGTWQAVIGPIRCGEDPRNGWIQKAGHWIKSIQKPDGSFGESANSYVERALMGQGPSTASQTAWAAMVLQEVFGPRDPDLRRAIEWLASTQLRSAPAPSPSEGEDRGEGERLNTAEGTLVQPLTPDDDPPGSWHEPWFTGTGFPRVFYLRYHLYRLYFPIMAIGRYLAARNAFKREASQVEVLEQREATVV